MDVPSTQQVAIVGCGLAGCGVVTILKETMGNESSPAAFLVAVDDDEEALNTAEADKKILVKAGEKLEPGIDFSQYGTVIFVLEPGEENLITYTQALASMASSAKAYTYGFQIKPAGGWKEDEKTIFGSFDGSSVVDEGWVLQLRGGKDPEYAMRIVLNFTAHTVMILAESLHSGKLNRDAFWKATYGKVAGFAATATSQPETLFQMTMSKIDKSRVKSTILFMPEDTDNILARRIFLHVSNALPKSAEMIALRVKYVEPFRIVAMLAS